jgi:hypothetical protein
MAHRLLVYGDGMPLQQLRRANSHPQLDGKPLGGSLNGGSPQGGSHEQDPPRGPPPNWKSTYWTLQMANH